MSGVHGGETSVVYTTHAAGIGLAGRINNLAHRDTTISIVLTLEELIQLSTTNPGFYNTPIGGNRSLAKYLAIGPFVFVGFWGISNQAIFVTVP